jgi:hypothetical protein
MSQMADIEWKEETGAGMRRLVCLRPSGYEARILVFGNELSARLGKPQENKDSFAVPPHAVPAEEVEPTVERLKAEIASRLDLLENGHS